MTVTPPPRRPSPRRGAWAWTVVLVTGTAVATWMAIGPRREEVTDPAYLDYVVEVPDPPRAVEAVIGMLAAIVAVGAVRRATRLSAGPGSVGRFALVVAVGVAIGAGVLIGGSGRVITAGGGGANIGAGFALVIGLPLAAVLAISAGALLRPSTATDPGRASASDRLG